MGHMREKRSGLMFGFFIVFRSRTEARERQQIHQRGMGENTGHTSANQQTTDTCHTRKHAHEKLAEEQMAQWTLSVSVGLQAASPALASSGRF